MYNVHVYNTVIILYIQDYVYTTIVTILLPRAHAQGVKQSVCMSVVVVVRTKIASLGVIGP